MGASVPKTAPALCLVLTLELLAELIQLIILIENHRGRNVWLVFWPASKWSWLVLQWSKWQKWHGGGAELCRGETGKEETEGRGAGTVLAAGSLEFCSPVTSNPNLRKPPQVFLETAAYIYWGLKDHFSLLILCQPHMFPWRTGWGFYQKPWMGAPLCQPATEK